MQSSTTLLTALLFSIVGAVKLSNIDTSLTFIYQNNLNASDDPNHRGAILLDSMTASAGSKACSQLGLSQNHLLTQPRFFHDLISFELFFAENLLLGLMFD